MFISRNFVFYLNFTLLTYLHQTNGVFLEQRVMPLRSSSIRSKRKFSNLRIKFKEKTYSQGFAAFNT